ncbi:unnamed protein product [Tuber melanosporum]|uniref:(Perigord truffle) hypothetical protein n=1 Tax=Tuber melanosporum (strain Mel28) TaxID=656061 RepID=D5GAM4_TUBMM|nr:uncharacterized protein GSTUM_00003683001 [Tuber melanosporum]CAZ81567.1 unnamed protein product [Tuber melanosporum]
MYPPPPPSPWCALRACDVSVPPRGIDSCPRGELNLGAWGRQVCLDRGAVIFCRWGTVRAFGFVLFWL